MLYNTPRRGGEFLWVNGVKVEFSLTSEGTKVSMHSFHASLGLII